jgi:hypothetical protein
VKDPLNYQAGVGFCMTLGFACLIACLAFPFLGLVIAVILLAMLVMSLLIWIFGEKKAEIAFYALCAVGLAAIIMATDTGLDYKVTGLVTIAVSWPIGLAWVVSSKSP